MVTGRPGLAKQSNRRVVFADFRAGRPENLYAKIATRLFIIVVLFWTRLNPPPLWQVSTAMQQIVKLG